MLWAVWKCVCRILIQPMWSHVLSRWETQYPVFCWYPLVVHYKSCCTSYESSAKGGGVWCHCLTAAKRRPSVPPCGEAMNVTKGISWMKNQMTTNLPLRSFCMQKTTKLNICICCFICFALKMKTEEYFNSKHFFCLCYLFYFLICKTELQSPFSMP